MCAQWCLTLCDPLGYSLPDFSICGISQAKILEWVAISYSPDLGIETTSLGVSALWGFFTTGPPWKPLNKNWRSANNLQNHIAIGKLSYHACCQVPIALNYYWIHDSASSYMECPKRHPSYCRILPLKMSNLGFTPLIIRQMCSCLVAKLCPTLRWSHGLQCSRLPCPLLSPWVCSDSCLLSPWYHPTVSSSVAPSPSVTLR